MPKKHLMFDFETMGKNALTNIVLDCSYLMFDWGRFESDTPYSCEELLDMAQKSKVDVAEQKKYGWTCTQADIAWWAEQSIEVKRSTLLPTKDDLSLEDFYEEIADFVRTNGPMERWWSRGNTFDPIVMQRVATQVGKYEEFDKLFMYWGVRDTRTFIDSKIEGHDIKNNFVPIEDESYWSTFFKHHDSRYDITAEVMRLQTLVRAESGFPMVDR